MHRYNNDFSIYDYNIALITDSFICQLTYTSTKTQRRDLFSLRVKLPPVTTSLTT